MENLPATKEELIQRFSAQLVPTFQGNEVSAYQGEPISDDSILKNCMKIRSAFPALPPEFYNILLEMVKEENFTDDRFRDAVHNVIKTCKYPTPTVANFITYDRTYKIFTYPEMLKKSDELGKEVWDHYKSIKLSWRKNPVWVSDDDIEQYKLHNLIINK